VDCEFEECGKKWPSTSCRYWQVSQEDFIQVDEIPATSRISVPLGLYYYASVFCIAVAFIATTVPSLYRDSYVQYQGIVMFIQNYREKI
jgi:hypothetical protein